MPLNGYHEIELVCWPIVLLIGGEISRVKTEVKAIFWKQHTLMCFLVVGPATIMGSLSLGIPLLVYISLVGVGGCLYLMFITKWRRYLASQLIAKP